MAITTRFPVYAQALILCPAPLPCLEDTHHHLRGSQLPQTHRRSRCMPIHRTSTSTPRTDKTQLTAPKYPIIFTKPADALAGPFDSISIHPDAQGMLDYERELTVVMARMRRTSPKSTPLSSSSATPQATTYPRATSSYPMCQAGDSATRSRWMGLRQQIPSVLQSRPNLRTWEIRRP